MTTTHERLAATPLKSVATTASAAPRRLAATAKPGVRWTVLHAVPRIAMQRAAKRGDLQGHLFNPATDPFPVFEQMRAGGPVYRGYFGSVVTSHAGVRQVLASNDVTVGIDRARLPGPLRSLAQWSVADAPFGPLESPSLLAVEPPDHTRYRKLVTRVFTARAVEKLRERAVRVADGLLDDLAGREEADLVESYCTMLPVTMIADILGVPAADRRRVLGFGEAAAPSLDVGLSWNRFRSVESGLDAFRIWLSGHIATLRDEPGEDLLSQLVSVREEGRGLNDRELAATAGLVLAAGFETTVNLLSNGIALLHDHPDQLDALRAGDASWTTAVNETLRLDPPVLLTGRTAQRDTEVEGVGVKAGSTVTAALAAANRDPDVFPDPTRFDVSRTNAGDHVAFSSGRHFCLGAALARMEGEVGLARLFERFPDLARRPGATRRPTRILRGYEHLPVTLGKPAA